MVTAFIHDLRLGDIPDEVQVAARRLLLDLAGVAAAGSRTRLSRIARDHVARHMAAGPGTTPATLMLDGRPASPPGVAFAGAATIDAFDAHDGHRLTKGHVGVVTLPALLAFEPLAPSDGAVFLAELVLGYEIGTRAGIALHATARDYHSSGAWNGLAAAAIGARRLGLDSDATAHALGIAEYHGGRGPMMRCIDNPSMVKDGSAQGALAGTAAALLAADGFTGAPAGMLADKVWTDLGSRWRILEHYLKPWPVCRWAQPAIEAVLRLRSENDFAADEIESVVVHTFQEAARLAVARPRDTESAQYSLPFPVAAALVRGTVGAAEIGADGLSDPAVLRLAERMRLVEDAAFSGRFPAERLARVEVELTDGRRLDTGPVAARGDPEDPLGETELIAKYESLAVPVLGMGRADALAKLVRALPDADIGTLRKLLTEAAPP